MTFTKEQLDDMVRDAQRLADEYSTGFYADEQVQDVALHVKALAAEVERLQAIGRTKGEAVILHCNRCGKRCSTEIPDDTVIGAWIECAECVLNDQPTCRWTFDDDNGKWDTGCGHGFLFVAGRPNEDGVEFCPYCGRRIEEVTT